MMSNAHPTFGRARCDGLAQIGPTRFDITGIRFLEGEAGAVGDGAGAAGDAASQGAADQQNNDGAARPPWGDDPSKFDPDKAWNLIQNVKGDLAQEKAKRDQAIADAVATAEKNVLANIAKALGGEPEPETDPVKLAATIAEKDSALTAAQTAILDAQRTAQVAIHGAALGANIPALLADPAFKTSLASVDPTQEAAVKAAITQALQANAALKQPPPRSGAGEHTGPTVQSLEAQLKAAQEKRDMPETIRLKRAIASARSAQQAP